MIARAHELAPSRRIHLAIDAPDVALVRSQGAIDLRVTGVHNARLQIDLSGSGHAEASGSTQKLKVYITGSATAHLEKLAIEEALVNVDGSGAVDIAAPNHLEAEIHGSGKISYQGAPVIEQTVRGSGQLVKR